MRRLLELLEAFRPHRTGFPKDATERDVIRMLMGERASLRHTEHFAIKRTQEKLRDEKPLGDRWKRDPEYRAHRRAYERLVKLAGERGVRWAA